MTTALQCLCISRNKKKPVNPTDQQKKPVNPTDQQTKPVNPTDQQKKPVNPTDQAVSLGQFGEWGTLSSNAWRQENLLRALKAGFSDE